MSDTTLTEALQPFHLDHCDAQDSRRRCSCGLEEILAARLAEHARILADVRALADEWAAEGDEMSHWFAAQVLYDVLDGQAPTQEALADRADAALDGYFLDRIENDQPPERSSFGQAPTRAEEGER